MELTYERDDDDPKPILIPVEKLTEDTLLQVIQSFVLREGTDYGMQDYSMEDKLARVKQQLVKGDVLLTFDPKTESVTLLGKEEYARRMQLIIS